MRVQLFSWNILNFEPWNLAYSKYQTKDPNGTLGKKRTLGLIKHRTLEENQTFDSVLDINRTLNDKKKEKRKISVKYHSVGLDRTLEKDHINLENEPCCHRVQTSYVHNMVVA